MDSFELIVWIVAVVGFIAAQLFKGRSGKPPAQEPPAGVQPKPPLLRHPRAVSQPDDPAASTTSESPSALANADWGRDPARIRDSQEQYPSHEASTPADTGLTPPLSPITETPAIVALAERVRREKAALAERVRREKAAHREAATPDHWQAPVFAHTGASGRRPPRDRHVDESARRRGPLFDARRDLTQAVIGATVLGPCRAEAPYDGAAGVPSVSR